MSHIYLWIAGSFWSNSTALNMIGRKGFLIWILDYLLWIKILLINHLLLCISSDSWCWLTIGLRFKTCILIIIIDQQIHFLLNLLLFQIGLLLSIVLGCKHHLMSLPLVHLRIWYLRGIYLKVLFCFGSLIIIDKLIICCVYLGHTLTIQL